MRQEIILARCQLCRDYDCSDRDMSTHETVTLHAPTHGCRSFFLLLIKQRQLKYQIFLVLWTEIATYVRQPHKCGLTTLYPTRVVRQDIGLWSIWSKWNRIKEAYQTSMAEIESGAI